MMSEAGTHVEDGNGESTFEIVDGNHAGSHADVGQGPSITLPPPSALPSFALSPQRGSLGSPPRMTATATAFQTAPAGTPPNTAAYFQAPSSTHTMPPPPPAASATSGSNPYSIRSAAHAESSHTAAAMPSFVMPPAAPAAAGPPSFGMPPAPAGASGPSVPTGSTGAYGLDMGGPFVTGETSGSGSPGHWTGGDQGGGAGLFGWIRGSQLLTKVAEKAKSSVDTMITTLDPQMKDYMFSSGGMEMAIASDKEVKITGIKDGFQRVFTQVTARGLGSPGSAIMAAQPLGFANGRRGAEERIRGLRQSGLVPVDIPIVTVEGFIFEASHNCFFDADCVLLDDPSRGIQLEIISQATPVPVNAVQLLQSHTPSDYQCRDSGFAVTTGQAVAEATGATPTEWKEKIGGINRRELIKNAAASLAWMYKQKLANVTLH